MGQVIDLQRWRELRERSDPVARLERAVRRVDKLVSAGAGRIEARVETELLAIAGALSTGLVEDAADRAERLAGRLAHPAARAPASKAR